ncbi:uncharacterized protein LOC131986626 [Centropristis striata]|uniref:uncharacterized protein LOC131986626 n=1 Tax=Centropristis striata TaxID=184440 RepID=UPI0027E0A23F|nr:uncharacterized protein LOC131986626 [Centropristis striata]
MLCTYSAALLTCYSVFSDQEHEHTSSSVTRDEESFKELFSVARDASIIPDISLDPVLATFLSLDSSASLQYQYDFLQRSMNVEQQAAFNLSVTEELRGSSRVTCGGVGVVALAMSLLFDLVSQQVRSQGSTVPSAQRPQVKSIFGISSSSRIGWIIYSYLRLIPGMANDQEKLAETTELHDNWLKLELIDHYERMTTKKRMSTVSMQEWLAGAAFHLHMRIHQVRLHSVPQGSAESLRLSYKTAVGRLVQGYTVYLHRNVRETPATRKPGTKTAGGPGQTNTSSRTNMTCSSDQIFNESLVDISDDKFNETTMPNSTAEACKSNRSGEDFGLNVSNRSVETQDVNRETLNNTAVYEDVQGVLVIEPLRNVSHNVQHHPCESPAIQQALVTQIMNAQDLERNRNFFLHPEKLFHSLLKQRDDFVLKTN